MKDWKEKDVSGSDFVMLCLKVCLVERKRIISVLVIKSVPERNTSSLHFKCPNWMFLLTAPGWYIAHIFRNIEAPVTPFP